MMTWLVSFSVVKEINMSFLSIVSSGAVYDHSAGHHDPVLPAGRLLRLRLLGHCLLSLHHTGGPVCAQGKTRALPSSHHLLPADYSSTRNELPFIRDLSYLGWYNISHNDLEIEPISLCQHQYLLKFSIVHLVLSAWGGCLQDLLFGTVWC